MGKYTDTAAVTQELSPSMSDMAFARFKSFCSRILGAQVDEIPTAQSIFMKQNLAIVFCGTLLFLLTNGFYLVKNHILRTTLPLDMIPLYMMVGACLAMLVFLLCCKDYGAPAARFALLAFYTVVIAAVTVFMVSCNYHDIGLSISMCYLFLIMIAPTYALSDTVFICVLILVSWYLPGKLPYAENYDLFKHFLLRVSIIIGFIVLHSIFLRQAADKRHIQEMSNTFIKLAYNDIMTGTLNKKALKTYCAFVTEKQDPERVSAIIYDIDDFKSYNDHYSHMKGDQVLLRVSEIVLRVLAQSDQYLFRFGGEEFAVVLPNATEDEARRVACQMLEAVRAAAIPRTDLPDRGIVTASFGVACGTKDELRDLSLAVKADKQLYLCKSGGKNCVAAGGTLYHGHKEASPCKASTSPISPANTPSGD